MFELKQLLLCLGLLVSFYSTGIHSFKRITLPELRAPIDYTALFAEKENFLSKYNLLGGVEVHVQLNAARKLFCSCAFKSHSEVNSLPNTRICPICVGEAGSLPQAPNLQAIQLGLRAAIGLNCSDVAEELIFNRKCYTYWDLPKNYQITQHQRPIGIHGSFRLSNAKNVRLKCIQLEEDSGRTMALQDSSQLFPDLATSNSKFALVDYNRAGLPVIEVVTELMIWENAREIVLFAKELSSFLKKNGICNSQEHSDVVIRCDVNISLQPKEKSSPPPPNFRVEIKNLNSFKSIEKAVNFEIDRQSHLLETKAFPAIASETRFFDEKLKVTKVSRSKFSHEEYHFSEEFDLPIIRIPKKLIDDLRCELHYIESEGSSRDANIRRLKAQGLDEQNTDFLLNNPQFLDFYGEVVSFGAPPKNVAKWILNDLVPLLGRETRIFQDFTKSKIGLCDYFKLKPPKVVELLNLTSQKIISTNSARKILKNMVFGNDPITIPLRSYASLKNMILVSDTSEFEEFVEKTIEKNWGRFFSKHTRSASKEASDSVKSPDDTQVRKCLNFFMGILMKDSKGKLDTSALRNIASKVILKKLHAI